MKPFILLAAILIAGYFTVTLARQAGIDYQNYLKSSLCIADHVASGIARADIEVDGAKCHIKGEVK